MNGGTAYADTYFKLTQDIELSGKWTPIGNKISWTERPFNGVFDGDGHAISGLDLDMSADTTNKYAGLFGEVSAKGVVKNLVVKGTVISGSTQEATGGVVGYLQTSGGNAGKVLNVGSAVQVTGASSAGGVVGSANYNTSISGSYFKGSVESSAIYRGIGGIVGSAQNSTAIISCYNTGAVEGTNSGTTYVGGISGSDGAIANCVNAGTVTNSYANGAGAIVGNQFRAISKAADACYYLEGSCEKAAAGGDKDNVVKLTAAQMVGIDVYPAGESTHLLDVLNVKDEANNVDYSGTWVSGGSLGQACPMLAWEYVQGTPVISGQPVGKLYANGETVEAITVTAALPEEAKDSGSLSFQWYASSDNVTFVEVSGSTDTATTSSYTPPLSAGEQGWYYCVVTDMFNGAAVTNRTDIVNVMLQSDATAAAPVFSAQPASVTVEQSDAATFAVEVGFGDVATGNGDLSYQWYKCDDAQKSNPQAIEGATASTYAGANTSTVGSTQYFYCVATNTFEQNKTATAQSDVASVTVKRIEVATPADLLKVAKNVNNGLKSYEGLTVTVVDDIDLATDDDTKEWTRIGDSSYGDFAWGGSGSRVFKGTFDGGGHVISGLKMTDAKQHVGLFGYTVGATIKNLVVRGDITKAGDDYGAAGVVGDAESTTIVHVGNEANVSADLTGQVAGIVGTATKGTTVSGCYNKGSIAGYGSYVGGIVGNAYSSSGANATITSCYNMGTITQLRGANNYAVGGISGRAGTVKNCLNVGSIVNSEGNTYYGAVTGTGFAAISSAEDSCYYLEGSSTVAADGSAKDNVTAVVADALAGREFYPAGSTSHFVDALNAGSYKGTWIRGDMTAAGQDCPALAWQIAPGKPAGISITGAATRVKVGEDTTVSATASLPEGGAGALSFAWYAKAGSADSVAIDASSAPTTDNGDGSKTSTLTVKGAIPSTVAYYCVITNTESGRAVSASSNSYVINFYDYGAATPTDAVISATPDVHEAMQAATGTELSAEAFFEEGATGVNDPADISYQWYSSSAEDGTYEAIDEATESTYTVPTEVVGTAYYKVGVKNTYYGETSAETMSAVPFKFEVTPRTASNEAELRAFAELVNGGVDFAGSTVMLTGDIELTGAWTPIGIQGAAFKGTFDGDGHTISGLSIESSESCQGFFGYVDGATVKNLVLKGTGVSGGSDTAALIGHSEHATAVLNVGNEVPVTVSSSSATGVAGIIGTANNPNGARITACYNAAAIISSGNGKIGGILGSGGYGLEVRSCYNAGAVSCMASSTNNGTGGIIGEGSSAKAYNCYNSGAITSTSNYVGAMTGYGASADASNYWLEGSCSKSGGSTSAVTVTAAELLATDMVTKLNSDASGNALAIDQQLYKAGTASINGGYPLLTWQGSIKGAIAVALGDYLNDAVNGITPAFKVTFGDGTVLPSDCYSVAYQDSDGTSVTAPIKVAGDYTAIITGNAPYWGSVAVDFTIQPSIADFAVGVEIDDQAYTGEAIEPEVVIDGLEEGVDYAVAYSDNVNEGTAHAIIIGFGTYGGTADIEFEIVKASIADCSIARIDVQQWTGAALKPAITVTNPAGVKLVSGVDYTAAYAANRAVGTAKVTVVGLGGYSGMKSATFDIVSEVKELAACSVEPIAAQRYSGKELTPALVVKDASGDVLALGDDYTVAYDDNIDRGTASVVITGAGSYVGTLVATFEIYGNVTADLSAATASAEPVSYTGAVAEPELTVTLPGIGSLKRGGEFVVEVPEDAIEPGTYTATVKPAPDASGISGSTIVEFEIVPCDIAENCVVSGITDKAYTGAEVEQSIAVANSLGVVLEEDEDYVVIYDDNQAVGTATVLIVGTGDHYDGTLVCTFDIMATTFKAAGVTATVKNQAYTGKALTPALTVKNLAGVELVKNIDYLVKFSNNTNVGTAKVTVVGRGAYSGTITASFAIEKGTQSVTGPAASYSKKATDSAFSLNAKASGGGALAYSSNATGVAKVDGSGKVTLVGAGTAIITVKAAATANYKETSKTVKITVTRAANTLTLTAKSTSKKPLAAKYKTKVTLAASKYVTVSKNASAGKITYAKASGNAKITLNKSTGALTVAKGLAKGTYPVKVNLTSAQTAKYNKATKQVTAYIKVA